MQIPDEQAYVNAPSGIEIAAIPGFSRKIVAYDDIGLDVGIDSNSGSPIEGVTYFVFRRVAGDTALWLDRIGRIITSNDRFGKASAAGPAFVFSRPGSSIEDGIGQIYELSGKGQKSTGTAVFANEEWYVAVRATSNVKTPDELRQWLIGTGASVRWPAASQPSKASQPVQRCETSMAWAEDATLTKPDLGTILVQASLSGQVVGEQSEPIRDELRLGPWCWDSDLSPSHSVYRQTGNSQAYLIAIQDAGRALRVAPGIMKGSDDKSPGSPHFITYVDLDRVEAYGQLDRLPSPAAAMKIVQEKPMLFRATTWGEGSKIDINSQVVADKK